ncbi:MAG: TIGR00730 family Rossman fold protein [Oligoflexia bacterium]|nr:TIGR00730 family Rossman fold protein [Oligoflexia bacterium]MBF0365591.1 TIGR00730 family Rossman fold protein [Oligoflexia bacterium]
MSDANELMERRSTRKRICVFCSASENISQDFIMLSAKVGTIICKQSLDLIYGGDSKGMMGELAKSVMHQQGYVLGIFPQLIEGNEIKNRDISKLIVVNDLFERKKNMLALSDLFLALPGGIGTIDEITEVLVHINLGIIKKTLIIFNFNNFYVDFIKHLEKMQSIGMVSEKIFKQIYIVNSIEELDQVFNTLKGKEILL